MSVVMRFCLVCGYTSGTSKSSGTNNSSITSVVMVAASRA